MTWPPPSLVDMAGFLAHGYKGPVLILTEILPPADLKGTEIVIAARASWMAWAVSCNPGIADLSLKLPIAPAGETPAVDGEIAKAFAKVRDSAPKTAPEDWSFTVRLAALIASSGPHPSPASLPTPRNPSTCFVMTCRSTPTNPRRSK